MKEADLAGRTELIEEIATTICGLRPEGRLAVAIDGVDGAGKTMFADELAAELEVFDQAVIRASIDGFHNPRAVRYHQGRDSLDGYFEDSYNHDALRTELLEPLRPGGTGKFRRAVFDHRTNQSVYPEPEQAHDTAVLVFDGIFLHRPELVDYWDHTVFLRVDFAVSMARCAKRDGGSPDPSAAENARCVQGQQRYLLECDPESQASVIVDNNDLRHPYRAL
jgi:uridine kinase